MQAGDKVASLDGVWLTIDNVVRTARISTVYNFRVADHHTYFVGSPDWQFAAWVHNTYRPRAVRSQLEARHGVGAVTSTTVAPSTGKMVHMAGRQHPVTGVMYDARGFPIFDPYTAFNAHIPRHLSGVADEAAHMRAATRELRSSLGIGRGQANRVAALRAIKNGQSYEGFTPVQLRQIIGGKKNIDGFTWHHHQDIGRLQLVDRVIHAETGHVGGLAMWFGY